MIHSTHLGCSVVFKLNLNSLNSRRLVSQWCSADYSKTGYRQAGKSGHYVGQSLRLSQRCHTDAPFIRPPSSDAGTTLSRVKAQHILVFHSCPITPDFPWISPPIGQPCSCWRRFIREKFLKTFIFINPWVWAAVEDQPRFFLIKLISMKSVMKILFKTICTFNCIQ